MNSRTLILIVITAIFMVVMMLNFASNTSIYTDFKTAKTSGEEVHVVGQWVKREQSYYDAQKDEFSFYLQDTLGNEAFVIYPDPKPVNFEQADKIVIIGKFENDTFFASKILMKCPSKYENKNL
jgi:cytochrome c-type biogenesis protein CcmE